MGCIFGSPARRVLAAHTGGGGTGTGAVGLVLALLGLASLVVCDVYHTCIFWRRLPCAAVLRCTRYPCSSIK